MEISYEAELIYDKNHGGELRILPACKGSKFRDGPKILMISHYN